MKGAIDTGRQKPNTGRTNQKLYFARLQQDQLARVLKDKSAFAWEAEALSCREAAILHLHGAYVAFLQELVRFYKLSGVLLSSEDVRLAMASRGQVAPEIAIFQQLEQRADSWLAALLRAHHLCLIAPDTLPADAPADEADTAALGRAISLVRVASDEPLSAPDLEAIASWQRELTAIIREFRSERVEY
ncbi:MAG: DUF6586 family protein [Moraxellaceae bacterium]